MGAGQSKEEALYQAVEKSNHQAVKTLRRDGASLEWKDKEGRTPLILACTRGDLYDMVITLLNEGAKLNAYRSGPHGGFPLHHAAKRGLDKTVLLLLSRGADPLAFNDDGLTPLDMARNRSHVSVVRIIEERICLFSGMMRELSGPGFLEVIVPQFVTKKIWVVVLPTEFGPRKPPRNELVIYQNPKVPIPRTVISLAKAEVEEPKFNQHDPTLIITATDRTAKVRFKFLAENEGDKAQLERFYRACALYFTEEPKHPPLEPHAGNLPHRQIESGAPSWFQGMSSPQVALQGLQALMRPSTPQSAGTTSVQNPHTPAVPPALGTSPSSGTSTGQAKPSMLVSPGEDSTRDEIALAMAINASLISASAEGVPVSPSAQRSSSWDWGRRNEGDKAEFGGWAEGEQSNYGGWGQGSSAGAGPSRLGPSSTNNPSTSEFKPEVVRQPLPGVSSPTSSGLASMPSQHLSATTTPSASPVPSAPPLPLDGPIHYPSIDTSPVQVNYTPATGDIIAGSPSSEKKAADEKVGPGQCVICWDAPAEAACVPCGHLAGCMDCLTEIKSKDWGCPVCRAQIQQVVKVYAV